MLYLLNVILWYTLCYNKSGEQHSPTYSGRSIQRKQNSWLDFRNSRSRKEGVGGGSCEHAPHRGEGQERAGGKRISLSYRMNEKVLTVF